MPIDREATLKKAEKLLRSGKLAGAIEEYVRLVEDQPHDWNSINALGDLYVRAGDADRAVAQFTTVADHLFGEGFFPRASALYKKALKVKNDHDHTLVRLIDIAERQGLMADAKAYLRELSKQRHDRGDERGVVDCLVRVASLPDADSESKVSAARALHGVNESVKAAAMLLGVADEFAQQNRTPDALETLVEAARLDPGNADLRRRLVRDCVAAGEIERTRPFLTPETAGDAPDLLLALARLEFSSGNDRGAHTHLTHLMRVAPDQSAAIVGVADALTTSGRLDSAYVCVEVVADAALAAEDVGGAVSVLRTFTGRQPHLHALTKLVEIAVDAEDDALMQDAQAQLADVYLEAGRGVEARVISEDLIAQDPTSGAHAERLRRALGLLGSAAPAHETHTASHASEPETEEVAAAGEGGSSSDRFVLTMSDESMDEPVPVGAKPLYPEPLEESHAPTTVLEPLEVDLTATLATLRAQALLLPPMPAMREGKAGAKDLESIFDELRSRVARDQQVQAAERYERGVRHLDQGRIVDAIADLQAAARMPILRFKAAASLGRLLSARGEVRDAVDWMERAAEAPPPTEDEGRALMYDLAAALERLGETARALAIFMEVEAESGGYRDVRDRIDRLSRAQERSDRA